MPRSDSGVSPAQSPRDSAIDYDIFRCTMDCAIAQAQSLDSSMDSVVPRADCLIDCSMPRSLVDSVVPRADCLIDCSMHRSLMDSVVPRADCLIDCSMHRSLMDSVVPRADFLIDCSMHRSLMNSVVPPARSAMPRSQSVIYTLPCLVVPVDVC